MRPDFSVMHSPRLTKRNGVLTRIAPEKMARGIPHPSHGRVSHVRASFFLEELEAAVVGFAGEDHEEDGALEDIDGGVGKSEAALEKAAAGADAADEDRDWDDGDGVLPGEKGDEDSGITVARHDGGVAGTLDGGDFDRAGETRRPAAEHAGDEDEFFPAATPPPWPRGRFRRRRARRSRRWCGS